MLTNLVEIHVDYKLMRRFRNSNLPGDVFPLNYMTKTICTLRVFLTVCVQFEGRGFKDVVAITSLGNNTCSGFVAILDRFVSN